MEQGFTLPVLPPSPRETWRERARRFWLGTWRGRVLLGSLVVWLLSLSGLSVPGLIRVPATIVAAIAAVFYGFVGARRLLRRLLWRIRTKLLLSYLFVAIVPLVLVTLFFSLAAVIAGILASQRVLTGQTTRLSRDLQTLAQVASGGLDLSSGRGRAALAQRLEAMSQAIPGLGYSVVQDGAVVASTEGAPRTLPEWIKAPGFAGVVSTDGRDVLRGIWVSPRGFVLLERPSDHVLREEIDHATGFRFISTGEGLDAETRGNTGVMDMVRRGILPSFAVLERRRWSDGEEGGIHGYFVQIRPAAYDAEWGPPAQIPPALFGALAIMGILFLGCYGVALVVGLLLARSITRNVHALHQGTLRLRRGEFDARIPVRGHDQLGELAESFNLMSEGIQDLLSERAEKDRLEEELRIARQIQMSLLPRETLSFPGLRTAALCLPATEVGGDYYDLLPLSEDRMGLVVADVSGKGTSAALYMAELKGIVLSLSRALSSPAELLREANRILTANLDHRSFITMMYAVVSTQERVMRVARAGHNPLVHFDSAQAKARLVTPAGLGLGIDPGPRFDEILEEVEIPLHSGDVFVFYTDGLSEAMNPRSELFGEPRLQQAVEEVGGADSEQIKDHLLEAIRDFASGTMLHDDLTLVVLKVQ